MNWTGQILPVKKIADKARAKGIEVLCDGAHSFAHLEYKIPDLGCDYFGTSLHKWLCAPFGSGMMYIKKEKIQNIWPLFGNDNPQSADIRKFESIGTRSFAIEQAIRNAIEFQLLIGSERKEKRLHFLKNYWTEKVKDMPKVKFYTSLKQEYSCALCTMGIEGMKPNDLENELFNNYKIHTTTVDFEAVHGVRITPHVYTSLRDLDLLVKAIKEIAVK
jgi:selenocysteine lyase/cysteine desulfurase